MFVQSRGARGVWQIPHHNMETAIQVSDNALCTRGPGKVERESS